MNPWIVWIWICLWLNCWLVHGQFFSFFNRDRNHHRHRKHHLQSLDPLGVNESYVRFDSFFTKDILKRRGAKCNLLGSVKDPRRRVANTKEWSKNTHLYIVGALKAGAEKSMPAVVENIRAITSYWQSYTMMLYMDNATIVNWKALNDPCLYILREQTDGGFSKNGSRTKRLATIRNWLLEQVAYSIATKHENPEDVYLMGMDLDSVNSYPFNMTVFEETMKVRQYFDAVTWYRKSFYDVWALRYYKYDLNTFFDFPDGRHSVDVIREDIAKDIVTGKDNHNLFPIISSFNGLALYNYSKTVGCQYIGFDPAVPDREDCEHVQFHKCIRDKHRARLFMHSQSISGN